MSAILAALALAATALPPYGPQISLEEARKVAAAAEAEALRRGGGVAVSVVDPAGRPVYFERLDGASFEAQALAERKARAAARTRRATRTDADRLAAGDRTVGLTPDAFPIPGGAPIIKGGRIIGAVGSAGGADEAIAAAGARALD